MWYEKFGATENFRIEKDIPNLVLQKIFYVNEVAWKIKYDRKFCESEK